MAGLSFGLLGGPVRGTEFPDFGAGRNLCQVPHLDQAKRARRRARFPTRKTGRKILQFSGSEICDFRYHRI
ncbi:hypothetical protein KBY22_15815 [Ruegeria pomeroyi]|uniref:Uncharacterized protein n=1 Tax=Ruegeria alba TaxID=2916756 RepID=A0ABS9NZL1_9RHOB|nr:hypothetical protein [Ruegeria alba]MCE8514173.1 hypothetical protein [Ruegeria pomeroyi]MCE8525629.1 hypothetical protein [Ruegeria pomeroyi]MCE8530749.1 hypothetical protein [Ruegeria pomeroyi]MCE8548395.1 hypothetical protein [Ruegeria pomeroyi]MCG6559651.1 hypothetical protein [Ruegeria alba]